MGGSGGARTEQQPIFARLCIKHECASLRAAPLAVTRHPACGRRGLHNVMRKTGVYKSLGKEGSEATVGGGASEGAPRRDGRGKLPRLRLRTNGVLTD